LRKGIIGTAAGREQNVQGEEQNPFSYFSFVSISLIVTIDRMMADTSH